MPKIYFIFAMLAITAVLGCKPVYMDPGPNPAKVEVDLKGRVDLSQWKGRYWRPEQAFWDWGLYLVSPDGKLAPLPPEKEERLKVIRSDTLDRATVFLVPPGNRKVRLIVEAYAFRPSSDGEISYGLASWQEDYELALTAGRIQKIAAEFIK